MSIALVAIVKNERHVLPRLFESVRGICDLAVISDTGSTDGTQEWLLMQGYLPVELHEDPWENMAVNRTKVLEHARDKADWLLMLDADMTVKGEPAGLDPEVDAYMLRLEAGPVEFWVERLFRGDAPWRFEGAAHEYPTMDGPINRRKLPGFEVEHHADGSNRKEKWARSIAAIINELAEGKNVARNTFYLANNYRDIGQTANAIKLYRERVAMGGWDEEVFYAQYQLGKLSGSLQELLSAHWMRPSRREPLVAMARLASRRAADTPPSEDLLFVDNSL